MPYITYAGRQYVVQTSPRGAQYIVRNRRKIYLSSIRRSMPLVRSGGQPAQPPRQRVLRRYEERCIAKMRDSYKFQQCVFSTAQKLAVQNPYAVCTSSLRRTFCA